MTYRATTHRTYTVSYTMNLHDTIFRFGKYAGQRVSAVAKDAPTYILWVATISPARSDPTLWRALRAHLLVAADSIEQRHQQQIAEARALAERRRQRQAQRQCQ